MKKDWQKPVLTILVRGAPDEQILRACKTAGHGGAKNRDSGCMQGRWCQNVCRGAQSS